MNWMVVDRRRTAEPERREADDDFETFFRRVYVRLAQASLVLTGSRSEAEDLAQEALARAFERWDRVRTMESREGYVYRTALNLNRKRLRRLAVRARKLLPGTPTDPLDRVETRTDVLRLISRLPRGQREALVLVEWLGLTTDEASHLLRIAPASVRGRIHRARSTLRSSQGESDE